MVGFDTPVTRTVLSMLAPSTKAASTAFHFPVRRRFILYTYTCHTGDVNNNLCFSLKSIKIC